MQPYWVRLGLGSIEGAKSILLTPETMKIIPGKYAPLWAVAKSNLSGWYVLLALLILSILSGCQKETEGCWDTPPGCSVEVTAEDVMCGYGAFGDVWLKTNDGLYLQPWDNLTEQKSLIAGQKYSIGYKVVERNDKYKDIYTCMAAVPSAKAIAITCLSAVTNN